jgi:hypothetical protein
MDEKFEIEMDEFREQMGEKYRRPRENKKVHRSILPPDFKLERRYLMFGAIGVLVLVVVFILFFGGGSGVSREDFNTISAKLDELEKRLTKLEGTNAKMASLESHVKELDQVVDRLNRSITSVPGRIRYHVVRSGETLSLIAQRYGITVNELCRINRLTPKSVIHPGQKILVTSGSEQ